MSPYVEIPDVPQEPPHVEDFVSALFQSAGYFVDQQVVEIQRAETGTIHILEIDVVATRYDALPPQSVIAEAKAGDWGIADLLKLLGWMTYLGQNRGAFLPEGVEQRGEGVPRCARRHTAFRPSAYIGEGQNAWRAAGAGCDTHRPLSSCHNETT